MIYLLLMVNIARVDSVFVGHMCHVTPGKGSCYIWRLSHAERICTFWYGTGVQTQLNNYTQRDLSHMLALIRVCMHYSRISIHNPSSHNTCAVLQCQALFVGRCDSFGVKKIICQINAFSRSFKRKCVLIHALLLKLFWIA